MAEALGCALRTVQGWERDGRVPHDPALRNLAATLKVDIAYLTGESDEPHAVREDEVPYRVQTEVANQLRAVMASFDDAELLKKAQLALADESATPSQRAQKAKPFVDELVRRDLSSALPSDAAKLLAKASETEPAG